MTPSTRRPAIAALACLLLVTGEAGAPGQSKDTELDRRAISIAQGIVKDPTSVTAVLDVIRIQKLWDLTTPGLVEGLVDKLGKLKKLHPEAALRLRELEREELLHEGRIEEAHEASLDAGFVHSWLIVGPFDNEDRKGYEREHGPEMDPDRSFDTTLAFPGDERPVSWRSVSSHRTTGRIDFANYLYPTTKVCGYAGTYVEVPRGMEVVVWAASGGTLKLWVDQSLVIEDDAYRAMGLDRHASSVKLGKGTHRILAQVCVDSGSWNIVVRLADRKGRPLKRLATLEPKKPYKPPKKPPKVGEVGHAFRILTSSLEEDPEDPGALASLARYMHLTRSDDLTETVAGDHAQKAAEATHTCRDLILLARTTDDAHIGLNALRKCTLVDPDNAEAAYLYALGMQRSMGEADFQNLVKDLASRFPDDLHMQLLWLQQYENMGMPATAYEELTRMREVFGDVPALLRASEYLSGTVMSAEESRKWKERLLVVRADEIDVRRDLLDLALGKADWQEARRHLDVLVAPDPDDTAILGYAASQHMAMNRTTEAEEALVRATEVSPHNPFWWQKLGRFYKLMGENDLALACYQTVLEINPNNVQVREYLAHLFPRSKFEREFIVGRDEILAMDESLEKEGPDPIPARDIASYDATLLVDQEVNRVFGNGMASTFVQKAVRVNTEQGEKMFRYIPIQYSPSSEDLDVLAARVYRTDGTVVDAAGTFMVPVFDPDVRIYYDMVQEIIEMPPLHEGDIVDVRYKVSDASPRNMWERHYGNVVIVQGTLPTTLFRYGLVTPQDLDIRVSVTPGSGLTEKTTDRPAEEQEQEPTTLRLYTREDVPAIEREPRMPPIAEVSPLIKVSTFKSWEDFGGWWWGLSSQMMVADKAIRDKVEELTEGKTSTEEKVASIFDWVIRSTRYIALEFGVHGYKPYASPLVVSRGFGDCKDKATLLYVMLREAGVEGALALVRTRGSGEIGSGFPFQFQFDHAIAYVPSLGLFLDGTVDYVGTNTLPPGDQDVFALIVQEDKVKTMRTPRMGYDKSKQEVSLAFDLKDNGDAEISGKMAIRGISKAYYRSTYQSQDTREERLEEELASIFPGLKLGKHSFEGLDEYGADVEIEFEATVPNFALAHEGDLQFAVLPSHNLFKNFASLSKRDFDVVVGHPRVFVDTYTYQAPPGREFVDVPPRLEMGKRGDPYWFSFDVNLDTPSRLVLTAELGFNEYRVGVQGYGAFRDFCQKVDDAMGQRAHSQEVKP
jgi:tetratricopeptide (TPR) repeat protein